MSNHLPFDRESVTWDSLSVHSASIQGLSLEEQWAASQAYLHLKAQFGDEFLSQAFTLYHPLLEYLCNYAPWTRKWAIWFSAALKDFQSAGNYQSLINRLIDRNKFGEGISVLTYAHKFLKEGFEICFDPPVVKKQVVKRPDFKISDIKSGVVLYVEVSEMGQSLQDMDIDTTFHAITSLLSFQSPFILYSGQVFKALSKNHLVEIVERVKEKIRVAQMGQGVQTLSIPGVIELGLALEVDKPALDVWARQRGFPGNSFSGPPLNTDEVYRIRRGIQKEQDQLPEESPNVVIIRNDRLFMFKTNLAHDINLLEEQVYEHSHLLFGIVSGNFTGTDGGHEQAKDEHIYIRKIYFDILQRHFIVIKNKFCKHQVSDGIQLRILNAIRNH